ncbi:hypothetical protein GCM10010400_60020 [Streptomyces aculeolatus]
MSLHLTRTPYVPVEVSLDLARLVSEHQTLREAVRALTAVSPEVIAYACASGSFADGRMGERAMTAAMSSAAAVPAMTTSGAMLSALNEIGARRTAIVTPYTPSVTGALEEFLEEGGIEVTGRASLGLTRHIWRVPYREVVEMARIAVAQGSPDALFISCTNLPTYDVIPQLEAELRMPVLSANQVTVWAALQRIGKEAVGPYQALLDPAARLGWASMPPPDATVLPDVTVLSAEPVLPPEVPAPPADVPAPPPPEAALAGSAQAQDADAADASEPLWPDDPGQWPA